MSGGGGTGGGMDSLALNRVFHDHECAYYDERFAIVHDARSARRARREVESELGRRLGDDELVLDVGCGTGWLAAGLRRSGVRRVIGSDLSEGMLDRAREAGAHPLLQADATMLPLPDGSVDVVAARGVLHHMPDVDAALQEWRRVLKPEGALVLTSEPTPVVDQHGEVLVRGLLALLRRPLTPEEDVWEMASMAANLHVFSPGEIADRARAAGFGSVDLRTTGFAATMVLTSSYVVHGRRPGLARRLPWRNLEALGRVADAVFWDRLLPPGQRHTVAGVLRP